VVKVEEVELEEVVKEEVEVKERERSSSAGGNLVRERMSLFSSSSMAERERDGEVIECDEEGKPG
jgi:hypothetical protein